MVHGLAYCTPSSIVGWLLEVTTSPIIQHFPSFITLFRSITMFSGTDGSLLNILQIYVEHGNISHNIASPTEHCYGFD